MSEVTGLVGDKTNTTFRSPGLSSRTLPSRSVRYEVDWLHMRAAEHLESGQSKPSRAAKLQDSLDLEHLIQEGKKDCKMSHQHSYIDYMF